MPPTPITCTNEDDYLTLFTNNVKVYSDDVKNPGVCNAALQTNILGVSNRAYIQNLDVEDELKVAGDSVLSGEVTIGSGVSPSTLSVYGDSRIAGILNVTGNATIDGTLGVGGVSTLGELNAGKTTITREPGLGHALTVTGTSNLSNTLTVVAGGVNVTGDSQFNSNTTIGVASPGANANLTVNGILTVNGPLEIQGTLSSDIDVVRRVTISALTVSVAGATELLFAEDYCFGAYFIMIDETDGPSSDKSLPDGAGAIFASCIKRATQKINKLSSIPGDKSGYIGAKWELRGNEMILKIWKTEQSVGDTADKHYVVRIMSPTKLIVTATPTPTP
jgi:hypothetical protein